MSAHCTSLCLHLYIFSPGSPTKHSLDILEATASEHDQQIQTYSHKASVNTGGSTTLGLESACTQRLCFPSISCLSCRLKTRLTSCVSSHVSLHFPLPRLILQRWNPPTVIKHNRLFAPHGCRRAFFFHVRHPCQRRHRHEQTHPPHKKEKTRVERLNACSMSLRRRCSGGGGGGWRATCETTDRLIVEPSTV